MVICFQRRQLAVTRDTEEWGLCTSMVFAVEVLHVADMAEVHREPGTVHRTDGTNFTGALFHALSASSTAASSAAAAASSDSGAGAAYLLVVVFNIFLLVTAADDRGGEDKDQGCGKGTRTQEPKAP